MKPDDRSFSRADVDLKTIQRTAAEWLARREAEGLGPTEMSRFEAWRAADSRHAAVYSEVEASWKSLDQLRGYPRSRDAADDPNLLAPSRHARGTLAPVIWAAAACLVIGAVVWFKPDSKKGTVAPTAGNVTSGVHVMHLPDGSNVSLTSDSDVIEQFTPGERRVHLIRGEAHFAVAKNPARPFIVEANGVLVRAVGTAFDVRLGTASVEVLVTEGTVQVRPPDAPGAAPGSLRAAPAVLVAGQHTVVRTDSKGAGFTPVVETLEASDQSRPADGQNVNLWFDAKPLSEVVVSINRLIAAQNGSIHLSIEDPGLGDMQITGRIRPDNVENFVTTLETNFGVIALHRANGEIVLRRAP